VETHERKTVHIDKVDVEERDGVMAIRLRPFRCPKKHTRSHFISVKDFKAFQKKHPTWNIVSVLWNVGPIYHYYGGQTWDFLRRGLASGTTEFFDAIRKAEKKDAFAVLHEEDFDKNKLLRFDGNSHTFYLLDSDMPWSRPYHFDYIGGVCNDNFDLNVAEKVLKVHPAVSDVKRIEIPHYNQSDGHTHAVEFSVELSQKDHDKLVRYWRDKRKADYWQGKLKEGLVHYWNWQTLKTYKGKKIKHRGAPDLLGLKKALKKEHK